MCISLCTTVNTAQNSSDNFLPSYPPDNCHCMNDVYWRGGERGSKSCKEVIKYASRQLSKCADNVVEDASGTYFWRIVSELCHLLAEIPQYTESRLVANQQLHITNITMRIMSTGNHTHIYMHTSLMAAGNFQGNYVLWGLTCRTAGLGKCSS